MKFFAVNDFLTKFGLSWLIILTLSAVVFAEKTAPHVSADVDANGVPILVKHLPDWETARKHAAIAANLSDLQKVSGNRPILNEVEFDAGTEAVTAVYNGARMVIVEFSTPQMAIDVDAKIAAKLAESPQPTATAYRKIGNYSVFVFDAPDEAAANTLLDNVAYEKTVTWFGDSPYPAIAAAQKERQELLTTGDLIVTVVKTSGIAVFAALGVGGLLGALVFYQRRREQDSADAYTDAGGMMRLNLDDITPQTNPNRLLENK